MEPLGRNVDAILLDFAGPEEIDLARGMRGVAAQDAWGLRLWCAKEAAAKALGTGFEGRPKAFVLVNADDAGSMFVKHRETGERVEARTLAIDDHLIAVAWRASAPHPESDDSASDAEAQPTLQGLAEE